MNSDINFCTSNAFNIINNKNLSYYTNSKNEITVTFNCNEANNKILNKNKNKNIVLGARVNLWK